MRACRSSRMKISRRISSRTRWIRSPRRLALLIRARSTPSASRDVKVELHHFGRAHTSGDTVVYFPDLKVVAVSDVVTTGKTGPLIDYAGGGSATDWTNVLAGILALDFDAAIPGNGDVLTKADVQAYKTKFDTVMARARDLVRMGVPQDQLLMQIKTDDIGWTPRVPKVDAFYAELSETK